MIRFGRFAILLRACPADSVRTWCRACCFFPGELRLSAEGAVEILVGLEPSRRELPAAKCGDRFCVYAHFLGGRVFSVPRNLQIPCFTLESGVFRLFWLLLV